MSRPSDYSQECADLICDRVADGQSVRRICSDDDMPNRSTVLRWLDQFPEFAAKHARARVLQADVLDEDMADIEDRTLNNEIDPAAARVVLGSKQWRAARMAPKKYGDRVEQIHSGELKIEKIERVIVDPKSIP